ncbi:stage III sporulation protein AF [Proteiniborus sp. MB09-C3]|uniref:stage III sporulation protein AF n=1 Tax=Proteiniborus sp. MB09-C3 TaxID=3050072 RepID=UPI0025542FC0|nr:stage III sporulation protein AF [Proteiniborus sp. MB09-C3]WIV10999.1 stage III sporulation protein AF [Proteiniborus sp. MB09-C3]
MIAFLKNWVVNIVVVIFFIAFIEILLPTSNMKKYVNMILGLLIIIVLINPIIKLMSSDINIDREVFYNIKSYNAFEIDRDESYFESQNQQITEVYKKKLENEIAEFLKTEENYKVLNVKVSIKEDIENEDFGLITGIEVYLGASNINNQNEQSIKIDEIEKVVINTDKSNSSNISEGDKVSSPGFERIIDSISSLYKVPKEKIIIILKA